MFCSCNVSAKELFLITVLKRPTLHLLLCKKLLLSDKKIRREVFVVCGLWVKKPGLALHELWPLCFLCLWSVIGGLARERRL
jgi:hypothetical protein